MSESLDQALEKKFKTVPTGGLIRRLERAEAFKADDEEYELSRRCRLGGQAWRWAVINGQERVEVYEVEDSAGE